MSLRTKVAIGMVITIIGLILLPVNLHLNYIPFFDKFAHFIACAVLTLVLSQIVSIRKAILITFIFVTGAEWLQFYIPHRGASLGDFLANTVGILSVWLAYKTKSLTFLSKYIKLPS